MKYQILRTILRKELEVGDLTDKGKGVYKFSNGKLVKKKYNKLIDEQK